MHNAAHISLISAGKVHPTKHLCAMSVKCLPSNFSGIPIYSEKCKTQIVGHDKKKLRVHLARTDGHIVSTSSKGSTINHLGGHSEDFAGSFFLSGSLRCQFLSPLVPMHDGTLCIAFCLSVCTGTKIRLVGLTANV